MRILLALLLVCVGSAALWAALDRRLDAPDWHGQFRGVSYSPSHLYTGTDAKEHIDDALIRSDMEQLSRVTKRVRTYSVNYGQDRIPYIAKEFGLKVSLGLWLGADEKANETEIARAIQVINDNPNTVDRIFVGNEAIGVRGELKPQQVADYIKRVKRAITNKRIEVGTAEVWGTWATRSD